LGPTAGEKHPLSPSTPPSASEIRAAKKLNRRKKGMAAAKVLQNVGC